MADINQMVHQATSGGGVGQKTAREVEVLLSANTGPFKDEMKKAGTAAGSVADALHRIEEAYVKTLRTIGRTGLGIGATMQASAVSAAWSAASFEESFARVAKTTGLENEFGQFAATLGIGSNALQQFADDIRMLSTEVPVPVQELAHLADVAGTLGVEADNLVQFADTAATLGAAINELSSTQAIAGLANLMGAFGDAPDTVNQLASSLAELANHTRGTADEMLMFSNRLAGMAVQVGMTSEEVLALGAAVSAIGVQPELGASALMQFFTKLSNAIQTGNQDLERFATVMGMSREELKELWAMEGATSVLFRFLQELSTQGEAASVSLQQVGLQGIATTQVLGGLAAQLDVVGEALDISNEAWEEGTAAAELAAIRFDTVVRALRRFRNSVAEVWRAMGQGFLPVMKAAIDTVTWFVNLFNRLPQPIKTVIGLFFGLGGAVVTLTSAAVLVFAKFHIFFMLLRAFPAILSVVASGFTKLAGALAALGAVGAARNATMLSNALLFLSGVLRNIPAAARRAWVFLGTTLVAAFRAVGNAAMWASRKVLAFAAKETIASMSTMPKVLKAIAAAFKSVGASAAGAAAAKAPFLVLLGKFAIIAGVITGAAWGLHRAYRALTDEGEEVIGSMERLIDETHGSYTALKELEQTFGAVTEAGVDFAKHASDIIAHLQDLSDAGEDAAAQDYLMRYGMVLMAQGADPETVQRQVERLAELARIPITFEYSFQDVTRGAGFEDQLRVASTTIGDLLERHGEEAMEPGFWRRWERVTWNMSEQFEADLTNYLDGIHDLVEGNEAARLVVAKELQEDLVEALESGDINQKFFDQALSELEDRGLVELRVEPPSGWEQTLDFQDPEMWPEVIDWTQDIADLLEDATLEGHEHVQLIAGAVRDVTGETRNLGDAMRDLTEDQVDELHQRLREIAEGIHDDKFFIPEAEEAINSLHAAWEGLDREDPLSEQDLERYRRHLGETFAQTVGHERALREAEQWMAALVDEGREYSEEWEYVNRLVQEWGGEMNRIRLRDLEQELNAMTAADQVAHLTREIQSLDMSIPRDVDLAQELMGRRAQAMDRAVGEFRQVMDNYDRLREQEARMVEDHNRRMERMEEDHQRRLTRMREQRDRSIEDANESLADRLEDIAEREKELMERRVETVSNAFDLMERIQSRPSASMGALAHNMELQNRVMAEMESNIRQLRQMGLEEDVMEALGFDDPRNFAQVQRMLNEALSDPGMIEEINRQWRRRVDVGESFVSEVEEADIGDTIASQMEEARQDARDAHEDQIEDIRRRYKEQLKDANETYARNVKDTEDNHTRQMNDIAKRIAELGQRNVEEIGDLIKRGVDTGIEGIAEMAQELESVMGLMETTMRHSLASLNETVDSGLNDTLESFKKLSSGMKDILEGEWAPVLEGFGAGIVGFASDLIDYTVDMAESAPQGPTPQTTHFGYQEGGFVPGTGNDDSVHALLTPGEFVMNPKAVEHYGVEFFESLNTQRFADGGRVGMPSSRGREYGGSGGLVKALTKALRDANLGAKSETNFGPITVEAHDVNDMLRQLEHRKRVTRLTKGHGGDPER